MRRVNGFPAWSMTISSSAAAPLSSSTAKSAAPAAAQPAVAYRIAWARSQSDVAAAQRLRHDVFVREMGARLQPLRGTPPGHDADRFDAFCEHLLLRTVPAADEPPIVVGTYRVMTPTAALRAGGFYSDTEFDLAPLRNELRHVAELGRSCVHADHRSGSAVMLMWSALADLPLWVRLCDLPMRYRRHLPDAAQSSPVRCMAAPAANG